MKRVVGPIPGAGPFLCSFACPHCVCVGSLPELQFPYTVQKHASEANCEFLVAVWVQRNPCLCIWPWHEWQLEDAAAPTILRERCTRANKKILTDIYSKREGCWFNSKLLVLSCVVWGTFSWVPLVLRPPLTVQKQTRGKFSVWTPQVLVWMIVFLFCNGTPGRLPKF